MIEHIDYHVTDHCNLKCAGCNQFGTLAKPWCIPYEQFCEEWQLVHDKELKINEIRILGGETLLHPELDRLLIFLRSLFPETAIVVYTNGILLAQQKEKLLPIFQKYRIILFISQYPNLKLNYEELQKGFPFVKQSYASSFMNTSLHTNPDFDKDKSFNNCNNSKVWKCRFLKNGRIYACSMIPNICHLIQYFPKLKSTPLGELDIEENGIDIKDHTVTEIENFLNQSMPACAFCNVVRAKEFKTWYPSEYKITEWIENGPVSNNSSS